MIVSKGPATERIPTVLYVEDHPVNVRLMERLLARRGGVQLVAAATGRDALQMAAVTRLDLVLLDLDLPDLPGEVVLERLWALPGRQLVPVVVLTADALPETEARLRGRGVSDHLTKPVDVARLYACLDSVLAPAGTRDQAC